MQRFVYDGDHIVLEFAGSASDLTHRHLHGPVVDQILADEVVTSLSQARSVRWPLADHQGTIRDLVDNAGTVLNHIKYDSFGKVTAETNAAVDFLFGYTGREKDEETGLYYYQARYYDPGVGRFVNEDPIGFLAGDANLYGYVENHPVYATDPTALKNGRSPSWGQCRVGLGNLARARTGGNPIQLKWSPGPSLVLWQCSTRQFLTSLSSVPSVMRS